jgi:hypothetical protein
MKQLRTHGAAAVVALALALAALMPLRAMAGEVSKDLVPESPIPTPHAGDPDDGGSGRPVLVISNADILVMVLKSYLGTVLHVYLPTRDEDLHLSRSPRLVMNRGFRAAKGPSR